MQGSFAPCAAPCLAAHHHHLAVHRLCSLRAWHQQRLARAAARCQYSAKQPALRLAAQSGTAEAETADAGTELAPNRQGYRSIKLAGCEFLIAETAAGLLDLSDVYVTDDESGISARPTVHGDMPAIAELYQEVPWTVEFLGDAVFSKDPEERVEKMFLIRVASSQPRRLDLEAVYELDHVSRSLSKGAVQRLVTTDDPREHILRIRDGQMILEDAFSALTAEEVVRQHETGADTSTEAAAQLDEDAPKDPIDAMYDNVEDTPDVPAVDYA